MDAGQLNQYLDDLNGAMKFKNTRLELFRNDFKENLELRQHIKLLLNSALGKFNQQPNRVTTKFIRTTEELEKLLREGNEIVDLNDISDFICQVNLRSNFPMQSRKTNPIILAFITAKARISLHKYILLLRSKNFSPFYCDTDSILFSGPINKPIPLEFSLAFGHFKHDLGKDSIIDKFEAYGRKNFSICYRRKGETKGATKNVIKVCGMTLKSAIVQEEMKTVLENATAKPKITQVRKIFKKDLAIRVPSVQRITFNNVDFRCERIIETSCPYLTTKPWGYKDQ